MKDYRGDEVLKRLHLFRNQPPLPKEEPVVEVLTEEPLHDRRPVGKKEHVPVLMPEYNILYDSLRSVSGWRYCNDAYASGTIVLVAGAQTSVQIKFAQSTRFRTSEWPGAVQMYYVIRSFGIAPLTVPATVGAIQCLLQDASGIAPLGDFSSNSGGNVSPDTILTTAIADPGNTVAGTLLVSLNAGASPVTYNYSFGFSVAYLLPARIGYKVIKYEQVDDEYNK